MEIANRMFWPPVSSVPPTLVVEAVGRKEGRDDCSQIVALFVLDLGADRLADAVEVSVDMVDENVRDDLLRAHRRRARQDHAALPELIVRETPHDGGCCGHA